MAGLRVFIQAVLFRKIVQLAAYYASAICIVFARMNAESKGEGRNSMKKFFHEMVESKVVEEHARRSVVFQKERSSRNLGNFFKISSSCLAAATRGNRANFQAWIHWKANFAVPPTSETFRSPHFFGLFPDLGNLIREISRKGNKGARFCKSFSEIARLFV